MVGPTLGNPGVIAGIHNGLTHNIAALGIEGSLYRSDVDPLLSAGRFSSPLQDKWIVTNSSYSGTDCVAIAQVNEQLVMLGNVATFSYSIFREKSPVRVLGRSHPKGYTAGSRTLAGSIIFVVFDRSPLSEVLKLFKFTRNPADRYSSPVADQLPPIDLFLSFGNEYGHTSVLKIYALEIVQENQVHSINDIYSENTMQYVARDMDVMMNSVEVGQFRDMLFERQLSGNFTDNFMASMIEHRRNIEQKIGEMDVEIARIYNAPPVVVDSKEIGDTLQKGDDALLGSATIKKEEYIKELERINNEILKHEKRIIGWNAQNVKDGVAQTDYLSHAPVGSRYSPSTIAVSKYGTLPSSTK